QLRQSLSRSGPYTTAIEKNQARTAMESSRACERDFASSPARPDNASAFIATIYRLLTTISRPVAAPARKEQTAQSCSDQNERRRFGIHCRRARSSCSQLHAG